MTFVVASKRVSAAGLTKRFGASLVIDVTSHGEDSWVKFSPFYAHRNIPVPLSTNCYGASVEGIWQGLKVFGQGGIDKGTIANATGKNLKRTVRMFGPVRGHQAGIESSELLDYAEARRLIYLPAYRWTLERRLQKELALLAEFGKDQQVVLLDYETNEDFTDLSKPLSHAGLIRCWLEGRWPDA